MGNYQKFDVAQFENVEKIEVEKPKGFLAKLKEKAKFGLAVPAVAVGAVTAQSAHANDNPLAQIGNAFTGAFTGVQAPLVALFVGAAGILILFVGWKYFKRGANSA